MEFMGYKRGGGAVGVRNYVAIIPVGACINEISVRVANKVPGVIALPHNQACSHLGKDVLTREQVLVGLGKNPNVAAVLLVGIGCEVVDIDRIAEQIAQSGKKVETVTISSEGTFSKVMEKSLKIARHLVKHTSQIQRESVSLDNLMLGVKCAGSDPFSGILLNPTVGKVADTIVKEGGSVVFSETTEMIGAEHIIAKRAVNKKTKERIYAIVNNMEKRIKAMGVDVRGTEPTPGNIKSGLTTIEEKAIGASIKGGTNPIQGVLSYGAKLPGKGLFIMDGPARTAEVLTGFAASGVQVVIIAMGSGLPTHLPYFPACPGNFPILPVIKLSMDSRKYSEDSVDVYLDTKLKENEIIEEGTKRLLKRMLEVISGEKRTNTESKKYIEPIIIYTTGPII